MSSPPDTVLITGCNGFVGYATILQALRQQYHVRAVVRREAAIAEILKGTSAKAYHDAGHLSFSHVPDFTAQDAFVQPSKGCIALIHIGSPVGTQLGDLSFGTLKSLDAVLYAAEQNHSIKRVIWTSSLMGHIVPQRQYSDHPQNVAMVDGRESEVAPITSQTTAPMFEPVPADATANLRYTYAKTAGVHHLHKYAATHANASFEIVIMNPTWVLGPSELVTSKAGALDGFHTNTLFGFLYGPFVGYGWGMTGRPEHMPMLAATVHVGDVAEAHVNAVKVPIPGKIRMFLLASDAPYGPVHNDAIDIVKKHYPDEVQFLSPEANHGQYLKTT